MGTSHTVAVLRGRNGAVSPLLFDGSPLLVSAVYARPDGTLSVGRDAVHSARLAPERFEPHPKRRIDDGSVLLGDAEISVQAMFTAILERVRDECVRVTGSLPPVTLTHPATWGPVRRQVLVDAADAAGTAVSRLVPEPVAAAGYFAERQATDMAVGSAIVVYDLGGGTFDISVVQRIASGFDVLAADGAADVGGVDVDHALMTHLGLPHRESTQWSRLLAPQTPDERRQRRHFLDDVRSAKERLSRDNQVSLLIPLVEKEAHLTRDELEVLARPLIDKTVRLTQALIRASGADSCDIAGLFLVGGASRMPLVGTLLHRATGIAPTVIEQPETVVAYGAIPVDHAATHHRTPRPQPRPRPVPSGTSTQAVPRPVRARVALPVQSARIVDSVLRDELALEEERGYLTDAMSAAMKLLARSDPKGAVERVRTLNREELINHVFVALADDAEAMTDALDAIPGDHPARAGALFKAALVIAPRSPETAANLFEECDHVLHSTPDPTRETAIDRLRNAAVWSAAADETHERRLLATRERNEHGGYRALCAAIRPLAATDPARAARVLPSAIALAQSAADIEKDGYDLTSMVSWVSVVDLPHAEALCQNMTDPGDHVHALTLLARVTENPEQARLLSAEAERRFPLMQEHQQQRGFQQLVETWAVTDPGRAEYLLANPLHGEPFNRWVMRSLVDELAAAHPVRAAQLYRLIPDEHAESAIDLTEDLLDIDVQAAERTAHSTHGRLDDWEFAMADLVERFAKVDLAAAERLATRLSDEISAPKLALAKGWAPSNPERAERWARAITGYASEAKVICALASVASGYAENTPKAAGRLLREATQMASELQDRWLPEPLIAIGAAAARIDPATATCVLTQAERLIQSKSGRYRDRLRADLAQAWIPIDRDRAEHLARSLPKDNHYRNSILVDIAVQAARHHGVSMPSPC